MGAKAPLQYFQKKLPLGLRPRFIIPKKFAIKATAPFHYTQKNLPLGLRPSFIIPKKICHKGYGPASL